MSHLDEETFGIRVAAADCKLTGRCSLMGEACAWVQMAKLNPPITIMSSVGDSWLVRESVFWLTGPNVRYVAVTCHQLACLRCASVGRVVMLSHTPKEVVAAFTLSTGSPSAVFGVGRNFPTP